MAEVSFDEIKQVIGGLYLDLVVANRDNQRLRETSAALLEATRPAVGQAEEAPVEPGTEPLPPTAIRRKQGG